MLTFNELIELRDKLVNGKIDIESVKEKCWDDFKESQRSWQTNDWKKRRAEFIKDNCEICGGEEILTIQHLSHPKKYSEYKKEKTTAFARDYIESNPSIDRSELRSHVLNKYEYIPIPLCPNCGSRNPNIRTRKSPQYLCTECRYEFDETVHKSVEELISTFLKNERATEVRDKCFVSKDKWRNKHNLSNISYWLQRELAKQKDSETIETEALLLYLNDNIKYLSFEDAITACRKCASNFDLNNRELCPKCKEHYKGVNYPTCIKCLPDEKRKTAYKKIQFGKDLDDLHKKLGID